MVKKTVFLFLIILLFSFTPAAAKVQDMAIDDLKNIEKMPVIEDIGTIARTIRSATETYRSAKSKITSAINYCQNAVKSITETWNKIESSGIKIKNYIENIIGSNYKKYSTYITLN